MPVKVMQKDGDKPIEKEVLAQSIVKISDAMRSLRSSGLNRRGILALVKDATKLPARDIETVMECLEDLKRIYCN